MAVRYLTTAIPYVNAAPHVGFAFELVLADVLARYRRQRGDRVRFLTGTDENSLSNVQAAARAGVEVRSFVERNAAAFRALRGPLDLSFDDFIRTSADPRHTAGVRRLWAACVEAGDVYLGRYEGPYCTGCEAFYRPAELVDGRCPEHGTVAEVVAEENHFFRLSRYAGELERLISAGRLRIEPEARRNEALAVIRDGLEDLSISRPRERSGGWGLPVPGDPSRVVYVWFDALANYLTALGYGTGLTLYRRWWLDADTRTHVIGKGILRFHAVYWPAILLSAGLPLPDELLVHGHLTVDGRKIGKSAGNTIDPVALADTYGTDALRYYLLRHVRSTQDGDVSEASLDRARSGELADGLGNLVQRSTALFTRYADGWVPAPGPLTPAEGRLRDAADGLPARVAAAVERFALHDALAAIWDLVGVANVYVTETAPWTLAKQPGDAERLSTVLYALVQVLGSIAHQLQPFLPGTAAEVGARLGGLPGRPGWGCVRAGAPVRDGPALYRKDQSISAARRASTSSSSAPRVRA